MKKKKKQKEEVWGKWPMTWEKNQWWRRRSFLLLNKWWRIKSFRPVSARIGKKRGESAHRQRVTASLCGAGAAALEPHPCLSEPCWRRKKKDTARTPESGESYRYRYFAKNDVSVQLSRRLESESSCWLLILIKAAKIRKKKTVISNLVHTFRQNIYSLGMQKCEWDL